MKFLNVLKAIGAFITFQQALVIDLEPCKCGSTDVKLYRYNKRKWRAKCLDCQFESVPRRFKRQAKRQWNKAVK